MGKIRPAPHLLGWPLHKLGKLRNGGGEGELWHGERGHEVRRGPPPAVLAPPTGAVIFWDADPVF